MVSTVADRTPAASERRVGARPAQSAYALCAWLFAGGIIVQVFLAGLAVLVDVGRWGDHRAFGSVLFLLPPMLLVTALAGRLPRRVVGLTALAILLFIVQFALVSVPAGTEIGVIRALHPVNALALFWLALHLARNSGRTKR